MLSHECREELKSAWFPNLTDSGLDRLIELLEKDSPLLLRGDWTSLSVVGCLATHIAWNHPVTSRLGREAGWMWLTSVAGINSERSYVLREWDQALGAGDRAVKAAFLAAFLDERKRRESASEGADCEVGEPSYEPDLSFFDKISSRG